MYKSIFTDEMGLDLAAALPYLKEWGLTHCDLRARIFQRPLDALGDAEMLEAKKLLDAHGFKVGCLQSSLAKVHLPDTARLEKEMHKLDRLIRASEIFDCKLVRTFFFWQPPHGQEQSVGELAVRPDVLAQVMELFLPFAEKARRSGLIFAFENCGCTKEECFRMIDALDVPGWGFAWDPKNSWMTDRAERERDLDGYLRRLAARTICAHVKSTGATWFDEGRFDPIPYDKVFQALAEAGFDGPVSIETHNYDSALSGVEACRKVLAVIDKAWPAAAAGAQQEVGLTAAAVQRAWKDDPVRFGVVGLGMGHNRALEITKTPGVRLVEVCDLRSERRERTAEACGVPAVADYDEMLGNPEVEAVMVMNETGRHAELACRALEAGKHVLVTKPMEILPSECERMIAAAERNRRLLGVDFCRRVRPSVLSLRAAVRNGFFGRLLSLSVALRINRTDGYFAADGGWRGTRALDGGVLSNQTIHHLDEIIFALGMPEAVRCDAWTQNHQIEMEDLALAVWRYADGAVVNVYATTCHPHASWNYQMEAHGTAGAYLHREGGIETAPVTRWFANRAWSDRAPFPETSEWINSMDNFAGALRGGAPLLATAKEGLNTIRVLSSMYESAYERQGAWVELRS